MKVRKGFVSNSSSSSFLIFASERIQSKEDWRKLFKEFDDDSEVQDLYTSSDLTANIINEILDEASEVLTQHSISGDSNIINDRWQGVDDTALCSWEMDNWKELILNKDFWLREEIRKMIEAHLDEKIEAIEATEFEYSSIEENLIFNIAESFSFAWYHTEEVYKAKELLVEAFTEIYVHQLIENLPDDSLIYYVETCTECSEDYRQGSLLRFNWHRVVDKRVQYIRIEHS